MSNIEQILSRLPPPLAIRLLLWQLQTMQAIINGNTHALSELTGNAPGPHPEKFEGKLAYTQILQEFMLDTLSAMKKMKAPEDRN